MADHPGLPVDYLSTRGQAPRQGFIDVLLAGLQSEDLGYGQTGVIVAELLGLPHATLILNVEKTDTGVRVKRELEEGWRGRKHSSHKRRR